MAQFVRFGKHTFNPEHITRIVSDDGGERYGGTIQRIFFIGHDKPLELTGDTPEGKLFTDWLEINSHEYNPSENDVVPFAIARDNRP